MFNLKRWIIAIFAIIGLVAAGSPAFAAIALSEDSTYKGEAVSINVSAGGPTVSGDYGDKTFDFSRGSTLGVNQVHQDSTTSGLAVLELKQDDVDAPIIVVSAQSSTDGSTSVYRNSGPLGATWGTMKVYVDTNDDGVADTIKWIRLYDSES